MNDQSIDFQPSTGGDDGIDFQQPDKSVAGFAGNLGSDIMNTGKSLASAGVSLTKNLIDPANINESITSGSLQPTKDKLSEDWQGTFIDSKSLFQEKAQENTGITPAYKTTKEEGPDHSKVFTVGVYLETELVVEGQGKSKQEAEQSAAQKALQIKGW